MTTINLSKPSDHNSNSSSHSGKSNDSYFPMTGVVKIATQFRFFESGNAFALEKCPLNWVNYVWSIRYKIYESFGIALVMCWDCICTHFLSLPIEQTAQTFYVIFVISISLMWVYHQQWTHIPTDWLTDITLPSPNSFLPFCAVKHISRSSEYIQIVGNQFIRHFLSLSRLGHGSWK